MSFQEAVFTVKLDLGFSTSLLLEFLGWPSPTRSWQNPPPPEEQGGDIPEIPYRLPILAPLLGFWLDPAPGTRAGDGHRAPTRHRLHVQAYGKPHRLALQRPFQVVFSPPLSRACLLNVWPRVGASGTSSRHCQVPRAQFCPRWDPKAWHPEAPSEWKESLPHLRSPMALITNQ